MLHRKTFWSVLFVVAALFATIAQPAVSDEGQHAGMADHVRLDATQQGAFEQPASAQANRRTPLPAHLATLLSDTSEIATSAPDPGIVQPLLIGGVPGCYGQTDNPHKSTHVEHTINVEARTVCPGGESYVDLDLYRSRWYGWQHLSGDDAAGWGEAETNAAKTCTHGSEYTYLGSSYHEVTDVGYAWTANSERLICP